MLAREPIGRLLLKMSLPAIFGMLVTALYNVVDTIFVGHAVGTVGIGGLSVVFPIQMLVISMSQTFGIGGASRISRCMGAGDADGAGFTFGNMLLLSLVFGMGCFMLGVLIPVPLLYLFGATDTILPSALDYYRIVNLSTPIMAFIMAAHNTARAEGNANFTMTAMTLGGVVNIVLDPVFIFALDMGIKGAAIATVISNVLSGLLFVFYFAMGKSEVPVGMRFVRFKKEVISEIIAVGSSSFARSGAMSFTTVLVNHTLKTLGGDIGIATFGIMFRLLMFLFMPLNGINQGLQPIVGFNYGARQFGRVVGSIRMANIFATCVATAAFIILMLYPEMLMRCFTHDADLVAMGKNALRSALFCLPLTGYQIIGGGVFQALGKAIPALLLTLSRQVLVLIPMVIILPRFFGLNGVWYAFPVSDFLTFVITWVLLKNVLEQLTRNK